MQGAREYCKVFTNPEQVGRLLILPSEHARGKTLGIWVVPDGYNATINGCSKLTGDCIRVYDVVSGQRGWTESYGWVHRGKWVEDFEELYKLRLEQWELKRKEIEDVRIAKAIVNEKATKTLLADYN